MHNKLKIVTLSCLIVAVILQILPFGVKMYYASDSNVFAEYYSYFNTIPFVSGDYTPFLSAIATSISLALVVTTLFVKANVLDLITLLMLGTATVLSLFSFVFGRDYITILSIVISVLLFVSTMLSIYSKAKS